MSTGNDYGPRDAQGVNWRILRREYLQQPPAVREGTRARATRCARPGSALRKEIDRGLYAPERRGELEELEAWYRGRLV